MVKYLFEKYNLFNINIILCSQFSGLNHRFTSYLINSMKKLFIIIPVILIILFGFLWWRFYFVFGEGVKAGQLNFIVKKGYMFKTWEGRIIQEGFKSETAGALQSNEFDFSIESDSIAKVLELNSGKFLELRYKEYFNAIPWRGNSNYIVSEIISIKDSKGTNSIPMQ